MGVPSFYRWLVGKYPKIKQNAIEVPESSGTEPNPNGIEFDNLYLDMNCIIHHSFHPEDQLFQPKTYNDVFQLVFDYIDRILNIVRPQKLLYMAIDGVVPQAKMNEQRARNFRSAGSSKITEQEEDPLRKKHEVSAGPIVITPGTVFMERLSKALEYYIRLRLNSDPTWMKIKVILSDANVPGEGEHKIMSFIRSQQNFNGYNPNLRHCLYGLDADLIMLALTTHEFYFFILRDGVVTENEDVTPVKKPYELVNICILREYLEFEMKIEQFKVEMDRVVDDFVFICIFLGNDFLPNIPSLEAHEYALDLLMEVYKRTLRETGGYLIDTAKIKDEKHEYIKISRVEKFLADVGTYEDDIFLKRYQVREKTMHRISQQELSGGDFGRSTWVINNTSELKDCLGEEQDTYKLKTFQDKIRLGYPGWKARYYKENFGAEDSNEIERTQKSVVEKYMEGLCWVLQYYFVGVCSWTWYYPYHYSPFASDLNNLSCEKINFKIGQPIKPFDQLMAVLPPKSSAELPRAYAELMKCKDSEMSKFYPEDIEIDMNGKRFLWQGIVKLPFIKVELLLGSTKMLESELQIDEVGRNSLRNDMIFIRNDAPLGLKLAPTSDDFKIPVDFASSEINGLVCSRKELKDGGFFLSPIQSMDNIKDDIVVSAEFLNPVVGAPVLRLLEYVEVPEKTITANDVQRRELWHEYNSRQTTTKNQGYSHRFDYRKDMVSGTRETWRCAGSGSSDSTGRGWRNTTYSNGSRPFTGNQGRGFAGGHETHHPRKHTVADAASSGFIRGRGSDGIAPGGNTAWARGSNRPQAAPSVGWSGRGRAQK